MKRINGSSFSWYESKKYLTIEHAEEVTPDVKRISNILDNWNSIFY